MMGNIGNLMRQLMDAKKRGEELAEKRFEASAGGDLVKVVSDGLGTLLEVTIDGAALGLDADDTELLQDAILAAVQEVTGEAQAQGAEIMRDLTGGLNLPGLGQ